jgi:DNA-binding GntR family transcriptional regulator
MQIILEQVTDLLRQRLVRQIYKPGERLLIDQIAHELGCSHTPIREALGRLQGEGLVSYRRHQGYHVTPLSDRELYEILDCRMMIETFAVQQTGVITDELVGHLETLHARYCDTAAQKRYFEQNAADREFHEAIVAASGNALLLRLFRSMNSHMRTMRLLNIGEWLSRNFEDTRGEHARILDAFQRRDKDQAAQTVAEHLRSVRKRVQRLAPLNPSGEADAGLTGKGTRRRRRSPAGHPETTVGGPAAPHDEGGLRDDERR